MATTTTDAPGYSASDAPRPARPGWLIAPWFDALFLANLGWPLVLLAAHGDGFDGQAGVQFWQLYFITTPHRWITLALVFLDGDRLGQRRGTFLGILAAVVILCVGVRLATGALTCLMAIDYVWNAWHFAAQHHGVYRIYGRLSEAAPPAGLTLEKWTLRGFLLYVILRVASATWADASWEGALALLDWGAAGVSAALLVGAIAQGPARSGGRVLYLASVLALYTTLLWAVHTRALGLVLALATASALFHAIEYLTLVSWSVRGRHARLGGAMGMLGHLAPRWGIALAMFVVVLGAGAWFMDQRFVEAWLFLNVIAAFLHYAYDGLIWRRAAPGGGA